jgi:gamma-glutamyltranspeptidase / glutathione hydrolase
MTVPTSPAVAPQHVPSMPAQPGRWTALAAALALALGLGACGGGGSDTVATVAADTACQVGTASGAVTVGSGVAGDPALPEPSSGFKLNVRPVRAANYMVVTANPLATKAGCDVLKAGGSAADAAVAVQMVLGLVEPQSSGLGGGAFILHYNAASKSLQSYDGRETAPAAATENYLRWVSDTAQTAPLPNARASGRSIGTPGTVRVLELLHRDHGRLTWASNFSAGVQLARDGFAISGRLADAIVLNRANLLRDPDAVAYFLNADGTPKVLGTRLTNPAYADTLRAIATAGSDAFYIGSIALDIVDEIRRDAAGAGAPGPLTPGLTTAADLARYEAKRRTPVCIVYRSTEVCGMGPPSSGGIAVAQTLGILENFNLASFGPSNVDIHGGKPSVMGVHLVSEAQRLAYADRNLYVADTDFVPLPGAGVAGMLDKNYLRTRSALIRMDRSLGTATAGVFPNVPPAGSSSQEGNGTSHVSIIDRDGNVVVMTTTIESSMGAYRFVRGFLLNNELTDFAAVPTDAGLPVANRVGPLKRPRSSMAPTIVFNRTADGQRGEVLMATGSPGGAAIIQFVTKTVVGVVDWGLDAQQATSQMNFGAANSPTTGLGGEHPNLVTANDGAGDPLVTGLRALGHTVSVAAQSSGVSTIIRSRTAEGRTVLVGGADPRREGLVLGDAAP